MASGGYLQDPATGRMAGSIGGARRAPGSLDAAPVPFPTAGSVVHAIRSLPVHALEALTVPVSGLTGAQRADLARDALLDRARRMPSAASWEDVWAELVGPRGGRGHLVVDSPACATCRGRRVAVSGGALSRSMSRGLPVGTCPDCRGAGRGPTLRIPARRRNS